MTVHGLAIAVHAWVAVGALLLSACGAPRQPAPVSDPADVDALSCAPFSAFLSRCEVDADCAVCTYTLDCCGSMAAIGVATTDAARCAALSSWCDAEHPAVCECVASPTLTDSGATATDPSTLVARCDVSPEDGEGVCRAHAQPPAR